MYFTNLFFNHIKKTMTSVSSGNQWVLWLSWTEPICHKYGMLFGDTKSFYLWQKIGLFIADQYWVRSSYGLFQLSTKKSNQLQLCWIWPTEHQHLFGKVKRWTMPVLEAGCNITPVLYHELYLGCTKKEQVLHPLLLILCHSAFSGTSFEANTKIALRCTLMLDNIITE